MSHVHTGIMARLPLSRSSNLAFRLIIFSSWRSFRSGTPSLLKNFKLSKNFGVSRSCLQSSHLVQYHHINIDMDSYYIFLRLFPIKYHTQCIEDRCQQVWGFSVAHQLKNVVLLHRYKSLKSRVIHRGHLHVTLYSAHNSKKLQKQSKSLLH